MPSEIANFEEWFRLELDATDAMNECVARRVYNSVAPPKVKFPYSIYQVVPLEDRTGQAGTSIQTRIFCDLQIYFKLTNDPSLILTVDAAVAAFRERVRTQRNRTFNDTSISLRHYRPIVRTLPGAVADEKIIVRGSTYKAWLSA